MHIISHLTLSTVVYHLFLDPFLIEPVYKTGILKMNLRFDQKAQFGYILKRFVFMSSEVDVCCALKNCILK